MAACHIPTQIEECFSHELHALLADTDQGIYIVLKIIT